MHEEYLLNKKPLQVDVIIVRKKADIRIEKAVGKIFRQHNIIEYKSPEDYLSINDFYKVYGYACIYQSNTDRVKEIDPELSKKENYWLQNLRTDLKAGGEIRNLMANYEKHRKSKDHAAVMNLIARANWEQMEVEKKMCDALNELFAEELKEADNRGREKFLAELIEKKLSKGRTIEEIAEALETDEATVRRIAEGLASRK